MALIISALFATTAASNGQWDQTNDAVDRSHPVTFTVAMHPADGAYEQVTRRLDDVSNPDSLAYGQYLTPDELRSITATPPDVVTRVQQAFRPAVCANTAGSALLCKAEASVAEQVLGTTLATYHHSRTGGVAVKVAAGSTVAIPSTVASDVAFISGINQLIEPRQSSVAASSNSNSNSNNNINSNSIDPTVVPETIRKLYNVTIRGDPSIIQCAGEFPGNWHQLNSDLSTFGVNNGLGNLSVAKHAGFPDDPNEAVSGETSLDIQYIAGVGLTNTNWLWNSGDWIFEMTQMLQNASADGGRPSVVSMSYGWSEAQQCGGVVNAPCSKMGLDNNGYVNRTNFELQKIGLLGITMLASSGDSGCHGRTDRVCLLNAKMHPGFPAASPFVTAVGGTQLDLKNHPYSTANATTPICVGSGVLNGRCAMAGYEIVSSTQTKSRITSGGGFSNVADRPAYQDAAVKAYLPQISLNSRIYNAAGRGYPDISALAHNYYIELNGVDSAEDGTSASSPVMGGLMALINAHRKRGGRPAVGFVNPLLYKVFSETNGSAFNDIVTGSNRCTESGCWCQTGFEAKPGWDASTGLGTPNFGRLLEAIDAIDARREAAIVATAAAAAAL